MADIQQNAKKEDYLYFLNSFYCKGKWGRDPTTNKSIRLQNDFMQINIKHCDTNETELKFIEEPYIDFYVTNDPKKYSYPQMSMELSELHKVRCKYNEKEKVMAQHLGLLNEFYDACKRGSEFDFVTQRTVDHRRQFIQDFLMNSPNIYMGDIDIEDYYKNKFMEIHGRDVYHKHGCFKHAFMDIETDQFFDDWNIGDQSSPINAISYKYKLTNTLYLMATRKPPMNNDPRYPEIAAKYSAAVKEVEDNFDKFVQEELMPHAHDDKLIVKGMFYDTEEELLLGFWDLIHETKPDFCGIWNMNFDIPYILKRMTKLGMDVINICCHPDVPEKYRHVKYIEDSQRNAKRIGAKSDSTQENSHPSRLWDWVHISGYTQFYDMMALYSLMRKRFILPSYKLDDIAEAETEYGKLDYHQFGYTIRKLAHQNFKIFFSYSGIDTQRLDQIENVTDDFNRSIIFADNTKLQTSQKISYVIKNKMFRIYWDFKDKEGNPCRRIIGNNVTYNIKEKISGAIIASPDKLKIKGTGILGYDGYVYEHVVDFDEASEYPRVILTFNISKNSIHSRMIRIEVGNEEIPNPQDFNKLLQTRYTSVFEIGEKYFGLPGIEDMIKKIENSYDIKKGKFNEKILNDVTPKRVSVYHDIESNNDSFNVEFGNGEIIGKKLA